MESLCPSVLMKTSYKKNKYAVLLRMAGAAGDWA